MTQERLLSGSHVITGPDEKTVSGFWDSVLCVSQEKTDQEEEGRSRAAAGCGQRVSKVQVRRSSLLSLGWLS